MGRYLAGGVGQGSGGEREGGMGEREGEMGGKEISEVCGIKSTS